MIIALINLLITIGIIALVYWLIKLVIVKAPFGFSDGVKNIILWVWLAVCVLTVVLILLSLAGIGTGVTSLHLLHN